MNIKKLSTSIAIAAIMAASIAPAAFADTDNTISGNGASSHNEITVENNNTTVVEQSNKTTANTVVISIADTGHNNASSNTGGNVSIDTGAASSTVTVSVIGGDNTATIPTPCGCESTTTNDISGNGDSSHNKVKDKKNNVTVVAQKAKTKANTLVVQKSKSGDNKAKNNTGGTVDITTNDATSSVDVTVAGGSNNL